MVFWCHLGNAVEKMALILSHLYVTGVKIVLRDNKADFVTLIKTVLVTVLTRDHQVYFMGKLKGFLGIVDKYSS